MKLLFLKFDLSHYMKILKTPDLLFLTSIGMSILFHYILPILELVSYPYSLIGIVLIIIGMITAFLTNSILLKKGTSIKPFENPSVLVASGPFKFSRNPIYLSMALALLGVAIFLGSLSPFIFPIIFVIMIDRSVIPIEETNLERRFGEEYLDYKTKVNRWV